MPSLSSLAMAGQCFDEVRNVNQNSHQAVKRYFAVKPRIVYKTRQLLLATQKNSLPASHQSNIAYQFLGH